MSKKSKTSRVKSTAVLSTMVLLGIFAVFTPKTLARYSGGTGEPNDPYRISTAEDLNDIGNHEDDWDKHFILVNDVNLAEYTGTRFKIIGRSYLTPFTGVFDGNDHKVRNFTWKSTERDNIGLFVCLRSSGQIKNLGMENVDVNSVNGNYVGSLVGISQGTIISCYSSGSVTGKYHVGGLTGFNRNTITDCYSTVSVLGNYIVGGLVGFNYYGTIKDCHSTSYVSGYGLVGGLVGANYEGVTTHCCYSGNVSGYEFIGGLVGENGGKITDSYSGGSVSGSDLVGGLVGQNGHATGIPEDPIYDGWIYNCYSTCIVVGNRAVGGLVGEHILGEIRDSFWDVQTSGKPNMCGYQLEDWATGCDPNCGKTTSEMQTRSTFTDVGWDFVEVWGIGEHQTYPYLRTEPAGDLNIDSKIDLLDLAILASHWLEGPP